MKKFILSLLFTLSSTAAFSNIPCLESSYMLASSQYEQICQLKERLKNDPQDLAAYRDLAKLYIQNEQLAKGLDLYFTALALNPDFIDVAFGKEIGPWKESDHFSVGSQPLPAENVWRGESLKGKTLLVYHKKGLGDTLQFCRFLVDVLQKEPAKILFIPQKGLEELFCTSFSHLPQIEILNSATAVSGLAFDYHTSLLRLPHILQIDIEKIAKEPYLQINPSSSSHQLESNGALKIGLFWNGDSRHIHNPARAIAFQKLYETLSDLPNVKLYAVQKGDGEEQLGDLPSEAIVRLSPFIHTFEDTARLLNQLDLFVTVDTSPSHLGGALGVPTVLLLCKECDMKWAEPLGGDNLWYESVMTLRQKNQGDWSFPLQQLREGVISLLEEKGLN